MNLERILAKNRERREQLSGQHVPKTDAIEPYDVIELDGMFWLADKWYTTGWNFLPLTEHGTAIASTKPVYFPHDEIMAGHALYAEVSI
jgi:hypothetical protein